jgi:hypothetical protein
MGTDMRSEAVAETAPTTTTVRRARRLARTRYSVVVRTRMAISERKTMPQMVRMLRACLARMAACRGVRWGRRNAKASVAVRC